jgi:class 3 adenylate cyclase
MTQAPTGTVTFLFTDIEGSTKLARENPDTWEALQERHHAILTSAIESHNGFIFHIMGDAFCAAFHTAGEALKAAVKAQQDLQREEWGDAAIHVRMGLHTGTAEWVENDYRGYLTLALVQRVMSAGYGGQILLSNTTENLLRGQLPKEFTLRDLDEHKFKDAPLLVGIFQVVAPGLQSN